ncbi:porin [Rhizobacter sp. P5_C2]
MNRRLSCLAAAAVAATLSAAASAQSASPSASSITLYGLIDMSAGRFQDAGAARTLRAESGKMTTSFLGFKGTEDLGGSLKLKFALEHYLRADTGSVGRTSADAFWARNAYVGFQGDFGTSLLGRNTTPLFVSTLSFNAIGDSFGFSPSIRQVFAPSTGLAFQGDSAWNNSLLYNTSNAEGYNVSLIGNLGEGAPGATGRNLGGNWVLLTDTWGATIAYQQVKNGLVAAPAGFNRQDTLQFGGTYDFTVVKLYAQATRVKTKATVDTKSTIYGLGLAVPVGALGKVVAQYGQANADFNPGEVKNRTVTLGYDHALSKLTDAYAVVMSDRLTNAENGTSVAAGLRVRF